MVAPIVEAKAIQLKVGVYFSLLGLTFVMIVPIVITTNNLGGCLLYWSRRGPGPSSNCDYIIGIAVIFQQMYVIYRLIMILLMKWRVFPDEFYEYSLMIDLIHTSVDAASLLFTFTAACILSAGIQFACEPNSHDCLYDMDDDFAVSRLHIAEAGTWISVVLWNVLVVVGVLWLLQKSQGMKFVIPADM